jgi:ATP-dependent Zn protease
MTSSVVAVACTGNSNIDISPQQITVSDTSISYAQDEEGRIITTFGVMKNGTEACIEDIVLEITYFDSQNKQIDVVTRTLFEVVIPPSQEVKLRIRGQADKPKESYSSSAVRVISAESQIKHNKTPLWQELLVNLSPMILLIGVSIFIARKYNGSKSPQQRSLAVLEAHLNAVTRQNEFLERLAVATEKLSQNK